MLTLRITQDTFAKQSTEPSETLTINEKQFIKAGEEFRVKFYTKEKGHLLVRLQQPLRVLGDSAFFFSGHIQIQEIRATWITNIDSKILKSKNNIEEGLKRLQELGFNTIYPVVWNKGFAFFKRSRTL